MPQHSNQILFSFFMFTVDLRPGDAEYTRLIVGRMRKLLELGYSGFDLPIAPPAGELDAKTELENYRKLRKALDDAGLRDVRLTTNVAATRTFDPSSEFKEQRELALAYLKSRVDICEALRADIMAGPVVMPYGVFPTTDFGQQIWSDELQDWLVARYNNAVPVLQALGEHAGALGVTVAIEPVDHWETPSPNMVGEVLRFLDKTDEASLGVCIDSAHVVLGSDGPGVFRNQVCEALTRERLPYVHISAPDRGAVHDSWIPWDTFLTPILQGFEGPYLIEVFNAIPAFLSSLRITRRKFWIPGEDVPHPEYPDAYTIAQEGLQAVRRRVRPAAAHV
ncbi:MAG TPA: sugar phosphate isomerase/epimerase family protein [Bryobacteraceae bacterium]|nr:sugar phosphate isomerase/epimerase family protein [Bryobacteraceae bacterium]